jgi:signal transduction histidine kinase
MKIRALLLLLVLSVILPAAVATVWTIAYTYRTERALLERNLRDSARALSMVVDAELSNRAAIAKVLALSSLLDAGSAASASDLASFGQRARLALGDSGAWVELSASDQVLLSTRPPAPAGHAAPRQGAIRPMTDTPAIAPLHQTATDTELRAALIEPVRREGRTLLNLAVMVLPQELQRIIDRQNLPAGWIAAILDGRGTVVARFPGGQAYSGRPATRDLKASIAGAREGLFQSISLDGQPMLGYFSTSPQGWTYVSAMPLPTQVLGLPAPVFNVALGALALLALAVAAALTVSRRVTAPIRALRRSAEQMQKGAPVPRLATGIAECDAVADALADAAAAMQRARADLQGQVASAVLQTQAAEKRVSQSRRVEALGRLTGGVAHDFNNVLGIISNSAQLMQRDGAPPEQRSPLAAILRAVDVGSRLTQYMMRFAGRQPVQPKPVRLQQYMSEVRELIDIVLGKRITLSVSVDSDVPAVSVDTSELELALINLALNARDALASGGQVSIEVRVARADETVELPIAAGAPCVVITFSDTGPGIDPHALEHVFEPFFTTKAAGKGTGLGLSQVHGFCVQAQGKAMVASSDAGTIVSLVLPAAGPGAAATQDAATSADVGSIAGTHLLLVEDNDELADVTARLLESFGCLVQRADSAAAALRAVEREPGIRLVLSDVVMPGEMDGLALARRLRTLKPQLPVVLISGYSSAFTEAHDFRVLHKPCTADEMLSALCAALR